MFFFLFPSQYLPLCIPQMCCMFEFYLWITWPAFYIFNKKKRKKMLNIFCMFNLLFKISGDMIDLP